MIRTQMNEKATFSAIVSSYAKGLEAKRSQRRKDMDEKWDKVDRGWDILKRRMADVGITKPASSNESLVQLNVGGSHLNIRRSVLASAKRSSVAWNQADLFDSVWDERVPRDKHGRIVLDESPVCVKRLMHMLLNTSAGTSSDSPGAGDAILAGDEPYLAYVSRALGLSDPLLELAIDVVGGSTILEPHGLGPLSATLQGWCPDTPDKLELVYRASRHGWRVADFHARCGEDSPSTITLFKVGNGNSASIAGGFSSVPWTATVLRSEHLPSRGSFVFMLKDGNKTSTADIFQPQKWGIKDEFSNNAIIRGSDILPTFVFFDLGGMVLGEAFRTLIAGICGPTRRAYDIPDDSPFLFLDGRAVAEIEVLRVCPQGVAIPPAKRARTVENDAPEKKSYRCLLSATSREDSYDQRKFGDDIAGVLMEERVALQQAQAELTTATHSLKAAGSALAAVFDPAVAAGEQDAVVELSVHGTRMRTLRSTLQACPDSALAARFDESKWPATEKDVDEHGWRIIDCKPSVFSSVLDVLRMRKQESWAESSKTGGGDVVRVVIDVADRDSFEVFVNKYFPGSERFIMDLVNPSTSSSALTVPPA